MRALTPRRRGPAPRAATSPHHVGLWLLMLALVLYGYTGVVVQMLGPAHQHRSASDGAAVHEPAWGIAALRTHGSAITQSFLDWRAANHARSHALGLAGHHHAHNAVARHHHAADDSTVVALPGQAASSAALADGVDAATAGSASLPLALAADLRLPPATVPAWHRAPRHGPTWADASPHRLDRPPQA